MDALHQVDRMLDDLLSDRGRDACKHQKNRLNGIMRLDDGHIALLGGLGSVFETKIARAETTIKGCYKGIVTLSLDVFECREKQRIAKRILHE